MRRRHPSNYPPPTLTPTEFERTVRSMLDARQGKLRDYKSNHLETISGADGEYTFDVTVRFTAFGVSYLTLIECKHKKTRAKRDDVIILLSKVHSVGAHKGIIFATGGFQSGAITYAKRHGIALVEVADGRSSYVVKAIETGLIPWGRIPDYIPQIVGWIIQGTAFTLVTATDRTLDLSDVPFVKGPG